MTPIGYLKLPESFIEDTVELNAAEFRELFCSMMVYSCHGEEHKPQMPVARGLWPFQKRSIDQMSALVAQKREAGRKGGLQTQARRRAKAVK